MPSLTARHAHWLHTRAGACGLAALAFVAGCSMIAGIDDLAYDLQADGGSPTTTSGGGGDGGAASATSSSSSATSASSSSSSATGTGGSGGATSSGGAGGAGGTGGMGGMGGMGGDGGAPTCGDGIISISVGEECDDQNMLAGDGCGADCQVECSDPGEFEDPTTHHCYRLYTDTKTWSVAGAVCAAEGFTLAAISSALEQTFIEGHLVPNTNTWVGGNDLAAEGVFVWSNGEIFSFTNWDAGEPNDNNGEDCMKLDGNSVPIGKWDDNDCSDTREYLCERVPQGI